MKLKDFTILLKDTTDKQLFLDKKFNQISIIRLIIFVFLFSGFIIGFFDKNNLAYIAGFVFLIAFIILLFYHGKIINKRTYIKSKKEILEKCLGRFKNDWQKFDDDGKQYLSDDTPQSKDLDLFGKSSLYQYICVSNTSYGKDALAKSLVNINPNKEEILQRQEAVQELSNKLEFSIHIQTLSNLLKNSKANHEDMEKFLKYGEEKSTALPIWIRLFTWLLPPITLISIILSIIQVIPFLVATICIFIQLIFMALGSNIKITILSPLFSFRNDIQAYEDIFVAFEKEEFKSKHLKKLQKHFIQNSGATESIKKLSFIVEAINLKYNPLIYLTACGLLMWDYQCIEAVEHWKKLYGTKLRYWIKSIGEMEALLSLSVLCHTKENYCFPNIIQNDIPKINVKDIFHPLIEEANVVYNSIKLESNTCIITGSNMSGKTTFMRSIGVNMALAYSGGPVCAKSFETTCMAVFTSMRIQDDVSQGISTFYAEILRIKSMVQYSILKKPMLVLIDEIFKGTNSSDRIIGASEVIKKLSQHWIISIISTHDFELCDLENDQQIKAINHHFSEYYINNEIKFDYVMKYGRCKTKNAQHLMRMAGII